MTSLSLSRRTSSGLCLGPLAAASAYDMVIASVCGGVRKALDAGSSKLWEEERRCSCGYLGDRVMKSDKENRAWKRSKSM